MEKVCFDTQIIIWGVKEDATDGQEEMIDRAKRFVQSLTDEGKGILVPAIVIAELLSAIEPADHQFFVNLFARLFEIQPFDTVAAMKFAELWRERRPQVQEYALEHGIQATREEMKADCLIVATGIAAGAEAIYSHDSLLREFANGRIPVHEIPIILEQGNLDLGAGAQT